VERHVVSGPLGPVTLRLPTGACLADDPAATDGRDLWWDGFSLSIGSGRTADDLLALDWRPAHAVVELDESQPPLHGLRRRELRLALEDRAAAHFVHDTAGPRDRDAEAASERLRYRFWEGADGTVRAGYRVRVADAARRVLLDEVLDSVEVAGA